MFPVSPVHILLSAARLFFFFFSFISHLPTLKSKMLLMQARSPKICGRIALKRFVWDSLSLLSADIVSPRRNVHVFSHGDSSWYVGDRTHPVGHFHLTLRSHHRYRFTSTSQTLASIPPLGVSLPWAPLVACRGLTGTNSTKQHFP